MTMLDLLTTKGFGPYRKSGSRHIGPCPICGGSGSTTRFVVRDGDDTGKCFSCGWGGGTVKLLRQLDGISCRQAHAWLHRTCERRDCPQYDTCHGLPAPRTLKAASVAVPATRSMAPVAATPVAPVHLWQQQAAAFLEDCHRRLLDTPDQLSYLAGRGFPLDAVRACRLGHNPTDRFCDRAAWGLPDERTDDGRPKRLWLPAGIVIPTTAGDTVHRLRIRRPAGEPRYYWVPGSGNGATLLGPGCRAVCIVESDLDAQLIHTLAGDIVTTIGLGTSSADPKDDITPHLQQAAVILVALDNDAAGQRGWDKWATRYPRQAQRLITPAGKDPGEAWQAGVDLRQWILDALPISCHPRHHPPAAPVESAPLPDPGTDIPSRQIDGRTIHFPRTPEQWRHTVQHGLIALGPREVNLIDHATPVEAVDMLLMVKEEFPGAFLAEIRPEPETALEVSA